LRGFAATSNPAFVSPVQETSATARIISGEPSRLIPAIRAVGYEVDDQAGALQVGGLPYFFNQSKCGLPASKVTVHNTAMIDALHKQAEVETLARGGSKRIRLGS